MRRAWQPREAQRLADAKYNQIRLSFARYVDNPLRRIAELHYKLWLAPEFGVGPHQGS